ncbi:FIG001881: hydrolase of alkaline phosphatase superfamily [Pseudoalteromonas luteoviolacea B = ATCC 29581]|nr:FIG001881: hydrolase of alkaline phosphatase superfamily [Pseudoalteromonas luteoviolacea B = ATCC 29581]
MNLNPQSPFASKASQLLSWGHWFTFANIALVLLISLGYLWADSAPTTWLGRLYMVITWLSHTSFITFLAFVLTIFPLSLIFPYPRHIRGMAAILATTGLAWLCLDTFVYFQLGYHINVGALSEIITVLMQALSAQPVFFTLIAVLLVTLFFVFELVVSNFAWRHLGELKQLKFPRYAAASIVTCFAASHSIHIWADANSYFDITKQDNVLPLSYPTTAKSLLAKHNLIDINDYKKSTEINLDPKLLDFSLATPLQECQAPDLEPQEVSEPLVKILVFKTKSQLNEFVKNQGELNAHKSMLHPADPYDSLFNLVYGLPSIYKKLLDSKQLPPWANDELVSVHGEKQFKHLAMKGRPIEIQIVDTAEEMAPYQSIIALSFENDSKAVITTSTFFSNINSFKKINGLVQPMDIVTTVLTNTLGCPELAQQTTLGHDFSSKQQDVGVNYSQGVFIAYKKDRITLIKSDGSYQQLSAAEGFVIDQKLDIPFLIQAIKQLKQFSQSGS